MADAKRPQVPYISTKEMIEVDRAMIEDYKIELIQMMENAGRNLARIATEKMLNGTALGKKVLVLAGTGGNGGGALVCARHLSNHGAEVHVYTTKRKDAFTPIPKHQFNILERMKLPIQTFEEISKYSGDVDIVIDGVIGYSLNGNPRGGAAALIKWANTQGKPILSLDAPSGVSTTDGTVYDPAIKATITMTLALPKNGLKKENVKKHVGELYLADISVPPELYSTLGVVVDKRLFQSDYLVRLF